LKLLLKAQSDSSVLDEQEVIYQVRNVNDGPVIVSTPRTFAEVGQLYEYRVEAEDIDHEVLSFELRGKPTWMSVDRDASSLLLYGVPSTRDTGSYELMITVSDGMLSAEQSFVLELPLSYARIEDIPVQEVAEGSPFPELRVEDYLTISEDRQVMVEVSYEGEALSIDLTGGMLQVAVLDSNWYGEEEVILALRETGVSTVVDRKEVIYRVLNVNDPPVIVSEQTDRRLQVGHAFQYELKAEDVDGDDLRYYHQVPDWLNVAGTGSLVLFGQPGGDDQGEHEVLVGVTDGQDSVEQRFVLRVELTLSVVKEVLISLYPNPARDYLRVEVQGFVEARLLDLQGRKVLETREQQLDIKKLKRGIYLVEVVTTDQVVRKRIRVE
jgi:hypothetical protein